MQDNFHHEAAADIGKQQGREARQGKGQRRLAGPDDRIPLGPVDHAHDLAAAADDDANNLQFPEPSQPVAPVQAGLTRADLDRIIQGIQQQLVEKFGLEG